MSAETELERMVVRLIGDTEQYQRSMREAVNTTESTIDQITGSIGGLKGALMSLAGVGAGISALWSAGKFEQTTTAFKGMIGNIEETKQTLADLTAFAAKTPFEMPEIEQAARGLITFGERGRELMQTLNLLGNAASATGSDFGFVAMVYNQIRGKGKMITEDFRQLASRGIISLDDLAKHFNKPKEAIDQMMTTGKIKFADLKAVLKELNAEGGRFNNQMVEQSTKFLGLWSTLKDAIGITSRTIGEVMLPAASAMVAEMITWLEVGRNFVTNHKTLVEWLIKGAVTLGALKSAMIAYSAVTGTLRAAHLILIGDFGKIATVLDHLVAIFITGYAKEAVVATTTSGVVVHANYAMSESAVVMASTYNTAVASMIASLQAYKAQQLSMIGGNGGLATRGASMAGQGAIAGAGPLLLGGSGAGKIIDVKVTTNAINAAKETSKFGSVLNAIKHPITSTVVGVGFLTASLSKLAAGFGKLTIAARLGVYGIVAWVTTKLTMWLAGGDEALEKFNKEMERSEKIRKSWSTNDAKKTASMTVVDPQEMKDTEKQLLDYKAMIKKTEADIASNDSWNPKEMIKTGTWNPTKWGFAESVGGPGNQERKQLVGDLADITAKSEAAGDRLQKMKEILGTKPDMLWLEKATEGFQKMSDGMQLKAETRGMDKNFADIYEFERQLNPAQHATASQMISTAKDRATTLYYQDQADAIDKVIKKTAEEANQVQWTSNQVKAYGGDMRFASEAQRKWVFDTLNWVDAQQAAQKQLEDIKGDVKSLNDSLQMQVATFNMTGTEADLYKLKLKGATDQELAMAKGLSSQLKNLESWKKLMEQGKELTEKQMTPMEKLNKQKEQFDEMLKWNVISLDTYNRALKEVEEQAHKDYTTEFKVDGIEALVWGSQAANKAWKEYQLGKMPLPQEIKKAQAVPQERKFEWQGEDTTVTTGSIDNAQQVEKLRNIETYMLDMRNIAQQYWQGEAVTLQPSGLI